jgi:hypothetical protein
VSQQVEPLRGVFRTALRDVLVLTAAVTVLGTVLGGVLVGTSGTLAGLVGGAVVLLVAGTTPLTMLRTAAASLTTAMAAVVGAWLVKTVIVLVAVVALRGSDAVDRRVFAWVVVTGLVCSVVTDARAVQAGRVPYVDPAAGQVAVTGEDVAVAGGIDDARDLGQVRGSGEVRGPGGLEEP